jgi:hypothetical protein
VREGREREWTGAWPEWRGRGNGLRPEREGKGEGDWVGGKKWKMNGPEGRKSTIISRK